MRQRLQRTYDPKPGVSVATLAYDYPARWNVPEHAHGSDQVIYATRGVMEVASGQSIWLIPPQFAIWIPSRTPHRIRMPGAVSMRTLYVREGLARKMPSACTVIAVTPFLREAIVEAVRIGGLSTRNVLHRALSDLILAHLQAAAPIPTSLSMPKDSRALAVAEAVLADLSHGSSLAKLSARAGASARTVERLFRRELGSDFETWRRQARLMHAVELLIAGRSVKEAAFAVGYRQPSAFVAMFRRVFGTTPRTWVSALTKAE